MDSYAIFYSRYSGKETVFVSRTNYYVFVFLFEFIEYNIIKFDWRTFYLNFPFVLRKRFFRELSSKSRGVKKQNNTPKFDKYKNVNFNKNTYVFHFYWRTDLSEIFKMYYFSNALSHKPLLENSFQRFLLHLRKSIIKSNIMETHAELLRLWSNLFEFRFSQFSSAVCTSRSFEIVVLTTLYG